MDKKPLRELSSVSFTLSAWFASQNSCIGKLDLDNKKLFVQVFSPSQLLDCSLIPNNGTSFSKPTSQLSAYPWVECDKMFLFNFLHGSNWFHCSTIFLFETADAELLASSPCFKSPTCTFEPSMLPSLSNFHKSSINLKSKSKTIRIIWYCLLEN